MMSPVQTLFGAAAAKLRARRLGNRQIMFAVRGGLEPALVTGTQAAGLHHSAHALLARQDAACGKLAPNPRPDIGSLHSGEDRFDVHSQGCVAEPTVWLVGTDLRGLPQPVLMKTAGADLQVTAQDHDRPGATMSLDKGIPHRDSLAKYIAAIFRMSRSMRTRDRSDSSRAITCCSAVTALPRTSRRRPAASAVSQLSSFAPTRPASGPPLIPSHRHAQAARLPA